MKYENVISRATKRQLDGVEFSLSFS